MSETDSVDNGNLRRDNIMDEEALSIDIASVSVPCIDKLQLLKKISSEFREKKSKFQSLSSVYKLTDILLFSLPVLIIQIFLATSSQFIQDRESTIKITITLTSISAIWLSFSLKFSFSALSEKCNACAHIYDVLLSQSAMRIHVLETGGDLRNLKKFLNFVLDLEHRYISEIDFPFKCCK